MCVHICFSVCQFKVEYNVKYGNVHASTDEVKKVIQKCNLEKTIEKFPEGLSTMVLEAVTVAAIISLVMMKLLVFHPSFTLCLSLLFATIVYYALLCSALLHRMIY